MIAPRRRGAFPVAPLAAVLLALAGCSTVGDAVDKINPFSSSAPKVKMAELTPIDTTAQLRILWQASVGNAGEFVFTPAVVGKTVFAAAKDGSITRIEDGRQVWRIAAGQPISGGVGADGKLVVVGTMKGDVLAFDAATGKEIWKAHTSSDILAAPALGNGIVVVRSGDSHIVAYDAADGRRRWVYQRSTPALTLRTNVGVLLEDRTIFAGFPGGKLVAINAANGSAVWEGTVALPKGATELERVADITSAPALNGRQACAAAFQGRVACFDLNSGGPLWTKELSSRAGLDSDDRNVYVSDDNGNVLAFDRDSGSSVWKQDKLALRGLSRPLALGSRVVVADTQGVVHVLRREDGAFAARLTTDGSAIAADPQRIPGGFLVQTRNGALYALSVE
ncbi:MAG: outer membrane protein assembly factor BamB [Rhodocyclaceae bacterium]|nr:outer membrane protein assembly factor BamB [Rhodocyclaceae bacterium]